MYNILLYKTAYKICVCMYYTSQFSIHNQMFENSIYCFIRNLKLTLTNSVQFRLEPRNVYLRTFFPVGAFVSQTTLTVWAFHSGFNEGHFIIVVRTKNLPSCRGKHSYTLMFIRDLEFAPRFWNSLTVKYSTMVLVKISTWKNVQKKY